MSSSENRNQYMKALLLLTISLAFQNSWADQDTHSHLMKLAQSALSVNQKLAPKEVPCLSGDYLMWVSRGDGKSTFHIRPQNDKVPGFNGSRDCELRTLPKGTKLYHWTNATAAQIISSKGKITQQDYLTDSHVKGGHYMSLDIYDSSDFGDHLIVSTLEQDTQFIDSKTCLPKGADERALVEVRDSAGPDRLRALGIAGGFSTWDGHTTWLSAIDERATSNLRMGTVKDFLSDSGMGTGNHPPADYVLLDQKLPLPKGDVWLRAHQPLLSRLIDGEMLSERERLELKRVLQDVMTKVHSRACGPFAVLQWLKSPGALATRMIQESGTDFALLRKQAEEEIAEEVKKGHRCYVNGQGYP